MIILDWSASLSFMAMYNLSDSREEVYQHVIIRREIAKIRTSSNPTTGLQSRKIRTSGSAGKKHGRAVLGKNYVPFEVVKRRKKNGKLGSEFRVDLRHVA